MVVLITGACGFLGLNLAKYFASLDSEVVGLDRERLDKTADKFLGNHRKNVRFLQADVTEPTCQEAVLSMVSSVDWIIHAAAITANEPQDVVVRINVIGTLNMLELALKVSCKRFVFVSSGAVYGKTDEDMLIPETHPLKGQSCYALTKITAEQLVIRQATLYGLDAVIARIGWIYGPMERPSPSRRQTSVVDQIIRLAGSGREILINDLQVVRDWTYVDDIARGIHALLETPHLSHRIYNVSSGRSYTMDELLSTMRTVLPELRFFLVEGTRANVFVNTENRRGPLAISRLAKQTGYKPLYSLYQGLKKCVALNGRGRTGCKHASCK